MSDRETLLLMSDQQNLAKTAAEYFAEGAQEARDRNTIFTVVLSGGETPLELFRVLADRRFREQLPWKHIHFFWSDERMVPAESPESNFGSAWRAFLRPNLVPWENVHRVRTELKDPILAAEDYEEELRNFFAGSFFREGPRFDLVFLGLGEDGHTASLFPGMANYSKTAWVVSAGARVTLTPLILNRARKVLVLVSGERKAKILKRALAPSEQPERYPIQEIHPEDGDLVWLVDRTAASCLNLPPERPGMRLDNSYPPNNAAARTSGTKK